jgi:hypothetical protein
MTSSKNIFCIIAIIAIFVSCSTHRELRKPKSTYTSSDIIKMAAYRVNYDVKKKDICDLYILDGVPYNDKNIDSVLQNFDKQDIRMISFLEIPVENTFWHKDCDIIPTIQTTLIEQKREYKIEVLNRILELYGKYDREIKIAGTSCQYCPLVALDHKYFFNEDEVLSEISKIKIREIDYIADYKTQHNPEFFGSLGKSGVVEIFTN